MLHQTCVEGLLSRPLSGPWHQCPPLVAVRIPLRSALISQKLVTTAKLLLIFKVVLGFATSGENQ